MNILSFDTCLNKMYVNLNGKSVVVENDATHYHSAYLISTIKNILKDNGLSPNDVECIATNIGPGSFTGIRACTTVARVFAQATDIEICPITSLEILSRISDAKRVLVALDARKESAYVGAYVVGECVLEPQVMKLDELKKILDEYDDVVADNALSKLLGCKSYQYDLGSIMYELAGKKPRIKWSELEPLYLQPPPVTLK